MPPSRPDVKTKIEKIDPSSPDEKVMARAAAAIKKGAVLVCPTDTGYAFSANALDTRAVMKVFHLKGRSFANPVHIAVGSIQEAEKYARVNEAARYLARRYLPGALTMVLPRTEIIPPLLVSGLDSVGIRIPDNLVMLRLITLTGLPLTATSANISGRPTPYAFGEIVAQFGEDMPDVAIVLDQGPLSNRELSTIVDLTVRPPQLIRQGRVSWLDIRDALRRF